MKSRQTMHIYVDNLSYSGNDVSHNLSDIINYVTEYRFQGGPEQPIRYLELRVNKNDIDSAYPSLIDSVVEGKTRLLVDAVDGGTFIITKMWLNDNEYDLVATGIEITLNTATLSSSLVNAINATNHDPPKIVKAIFDDWKSTLDLTTAQDGYADEYQIYFSPSVSDTRTAPGYKIGFKENMPTLVAINMCALLDNAFVFFADKDGINTLYYVKYEDIHPLAYNPGDLNKNGVVNIYPRLNSQYISYTKFDLMMYKQLIGLSSKRSEGSETIVNNQIVSMEGAKGEAQSTESMRMYGDYAGTAVISDMMVSYAYTDPQTSEVTDTATIIARNLVRRYKDPTRSITIELSEVVNTDNGSGWEGAIPPFSYAYRINDNVNNISLTNTHLCDGQPDNFILRLSTFIRSYPEMTTEYTFGVMKETTLSQELANKLTGMSGTLSDLRYDGTTSIVVNGVAFVDADPTDNSKNPVSSGGVYDALDGKQDTLVSGTNIKTIGNQSLLGSGDIAVTPNNPTLVWNQEVTLGTVAGQTFKVTMPQNPDTDSKATSGELLATKLYLIGATTQSSNGQTTYSNGNVYIDTDNKLHTTVVGNVEGNADTADALSVSATQSIATTPGVQIINTTILSHTSDWLIETFASGTKIVQRAVSLTDPSNVCIRASTDSGSNWVGWNYSYAVWKA